jgi:hypothetical protein
MEYKPIETDKQYEEALARVSLLIDLSIADTITSDQIEELDLLASNVENYEERWI